MAAKKKGGVPPQLAPYVKKAAGKASPKTMASPTGQGGGLGAATNVRSSAGYSRQPAAGGGIGAKSGRGMPASNAADYSTGGSPGKPATAGGTGTQRKQAFGVTSGSSRPSRRGRASGHAEGASTAAGYNPSDGKPQTMSVPADHVPAHTFAATTLPRKRQTGASAPKTPQDGDADDYHLSAAAPEPSAELAAPQKKFPKGGIIKPSRKGLFTAKAKAAGMSVQAYASHVLSAKKGTFPPDTVRQANFARNFGGGK